MKFNEQLGFKTAAGIKAVVSNIQKYPFHFHKNYIEIVCSVRGEAEVHDSAMVYRLREDRMHLINSTDPHKVECLDEDGMVLMVHIDTDRYLMRYKDLERVLFVMESHGEWDQQMPEMKLMRFLMASAYREYSREKPSAIVLDHIAEKMLELLYDEFKDYAYELTGGTYNIVRRRKDGQNEGEFYRIYRIAEYIEQNFRDRIRLSDIAEREFLSVPYLSRFIKKNIGITFSDLLSITRCSEAERLLANTRKSMEQIATEVGFANQSHLFRHFNRWFDRTPPQYRKMIFNELDEGDHIEFGRTDEDHLRKVMGRYIDY